MLILLGPSKLDYLSAVSELNYMTQIVIMLYEDNNKVWSYIVYLHTHIDHTTHTHRL